ncbi:MAG: DUF2924 domain-containing protein [Myxococcales bacterium]|nr:DUF2924 domain-containing protein [Myxococcales bacterium]
MKASAENGAATKASLTRAQASPNYNDPTVLRRIAALQSMDLDQLRDKWRELCGTEPPGYGKVMMRKRLAFRIQELTWGGISEETKVRMKQVLKDAGYDELGRKVRTANPDQLLPGTMLIREWNNERHEVMVLDGGFDYRGRRFKSLSAVARHITGTKWNGPLFFGLRDNGDK